MSTGGLLRAHPRGQPGGQGRGVLPGPALLLAGYQRAARPPDRRDAHGIFEAFCRNLTESLESLRAQDDETKGNHTATTGGVFYVAVRV